MKTELLKITGDETHDREVVSRAAEIIREGGLVAIPTETVYGLAGSALLSASAPKIYSAKGRPADNPLIVHIAEPGDAERIAYTNETYYKLAEQFMPGALTVILPKREIIPDSVTGGLDSVAVRCPSNPVANALIRMSGHPIAAPSANRSGAPSPTTAQHVYDDMNGIIPMIIDGGECDIGVESTVVRIDSDGCTILRPGAVTAEMLGTICEHVAVAKAVTDPDSVKDQRVESPGMKYKHYAPQAEVILIDIDAEGFVSYVNTHAEGNYGVLCNSEDIPRLSGGVALDIGRRGDAKTANHRFFAWLREADVRGLERVYAQLPPQSGEYLALYNRIIRAAGHKILKP